MIENATFLVTSDTARRTGLTESRYRTEDGRYVMDARDLSRIRMTAYELANGLRGIEKVSTEDAKTLIARGGFKMGKEGKR